MASFIKSDLEFILQQIVFAERHAAGEDLRTMFPNTEVAFGLRTIDGSFNNLLPGQSEFGAADNVFPRLTDPVFRPGTFRSWPGPPRHAHFHTQTSGLVGTASAHHCNLIVDMTATNPAAVRPRLQTRGPLEWCSARPDGRQTFQTFLTRM
jgi:hypothetical protein